MLRNLAKVSRFVEVALCAAIAVIARLAVLVNLYLEIFASLNPLLRKIFTDFFFFVYFYVLQSYVSECYTEATEKSHRGSILTSFIAL